MCLCMMSMRRNHLESILEEPVIEPRYANGENQAAIQSQKVETGKDDKCDEGDSLPLCYSSFELIRHMIKTSNKKHKLEEMVPSKNLYGKEEDKEERSCNPYPAIDTSGVCDDILSYEEGDDSPK